MMHFWRALDEILVVRVGQFMVGCMCGMIPRLALLLLQVFRTLLDPPLRGRSICRFLHNPSLPGNSKSQRLQYSTWPAEETSPCSGAEKRK